MTPHEGSTRPVVVSRHEAHELRAALTDLREQVARDVETLHEPLYSPAWNAAVNAAARRIRRGARR